MYKKGFLNNSNNLQKFRTLQNKLSCLIETSNQEHFSKIAKKLSDPSISSKTHWYIYKKCLTGEKVPCIPPSFHENKFITGFREKAEIFISQFANQCSLIKNTSVLLLTVKILQINPYITLPLLTMTLGK